MEFAANVSSIKISLKRALHACSLTSFAGNSRGDWSDQHCVASQFVEFYNLPRDLRQPISRRDMPLGCGDRRQVRRPGPTA
jgi:hypothetical protein